MRLRWRAALAVALAGASIGLASPAQASHDCVLGPPPEETLVDLSGPIKIYAGRVPGYATAVAGWIANYATCVGTTTASCVRAAGPQTPLVEVDPETLTITIYDDNIVGDASCLFSDHD
ncbi:MAG: hypothetical protein M3323_04195 [Actinomycetota bacterium]|nr:hypothetical protein [Actinomycetota bacterium]